MKKYQQLLLFSIFFSFVNSVASANEEAYFELLRRQPDALDKLVAQYAVRVRDKNTESKQYAVGFIRNNRPSRADSNSCMSDLLPLMGPDKVDLEVLMMDLEITIFSGDLNPDDKSFNKSIWP